MGRPTAADLIEALRRPGESYEALAARLPISLSTVNRWKRKSPADWEAIVEMFEQAGWISKSSGTGSASASSEEDETVVALARLEKTVARLARAVEGFVAAEPTQAARTTRRARRPSGTAKP